MSKLRLTCAGLDYWDRSRGLMDGSIKPTGIDLNYLIVPPGVLFRRTAQFAEFEVSEFSMSTYTALYARGDRRFVGIPVFPSRNFRHGYLWINTRAGIDKPEDLKGNRIGVPEYQMTAALWIRAVLDHDYGVKPSDMLRAERISSSIEAVCSSALVGMQPRCRQVPPNAGSFSTTAVVMPSCAARIAAT